MPLAADTKGENRMPLIFPRVAVVGLGLIGGSVAKTIKRRFPETYVIAVDADAATLQAALDTGAADEVLPVSGMAAAAGADLVVLAAHGDAALGALTALAPLAGPGTVITDTCSTKAELMDHALELKKAHPALCYVGGHPMAGSDKAGFKHSSDHLLENAAYLLCPMPGAEQALERLSAFLTALGALPLTLDPGEHDLYMAAISHLPHVAAAGLVNVARLHDDEKGTLRVLAAGGFRDLTRIASSPPALWHGISVSNRECLLRLLLDYISALEQFCRALNWEDGKVVESFFARAQEYRDSFAAADKTPLGLLYPLAVDVMDRPGVIAEITRLLAGADVNIRNLYIAESREQEGGCLRLAFASRDIRARAAALLKESGYSVTVIGD
jgi:prephenate dehydrogenase